MSVEGLVAGMAVEGCRLVVVIAVKRVALGVVVEVVTANSLKIVESLDFVITTVRG